MKKILLIALVGLIAQFGFGQTTATDFTVNDCSGNSHHLFSELDSGYVIVMTWVMPCGACIPVASTAASTAQGYSSSYPGRVKFYLVDDYANTTCSTLSSWATTNSISVKIIFSNAAISMTDYGTAAMQKTVVLGGSNHTVFYNVNGTVSVSPLQTAITNALAASGIENYNNIISGFSAYPSPASSATKITYTLTRTTNIRIDILNVLGDKVNTISIGEQSPGKQEYPINIESMKEGVYFIKINAGEAVETIKMTVVH